VIFCPWEALLGDEKGRGRKKCWFVLREWMWVLASVAAREKPWWPGHLFGTPACAMKAPPKAASFPWTSDAPFPILFLQHSYFSLLLFHPSKAFVNKPLYPIPSEIPSTASIS